MKFNFRKITSVLTSAVMIGSTIGFASAANYPAPFVAGGNHDVAVIVGSSAASSDYLAALDVGQNLQLKLAEQTAVSGSVSGASSSGENINLKLDPTLLYYNSSLNSARTSLSKNELKTLLADGSIIDDTGTTYGYTQIITLGGAKVDYSRSGSDLTDPALIVQVGTTSSNPAYQYKLSFNKNINVTSSDVQGNEIDILGTKYTIGSGSSGKSKKIVLFGAGDVVTLNEGESTTVTIAGNEHTIDVQAITQTSSTDKVSVSVDGGAAKEISEGSSSKISGLDIYAKTVVYSAKESTTNYATLNIGSSKLTLTDGSSVLTGSEDDTVTGTKVNVSTTGTDDEPKITSFSVNFSMQTSSKDHIAPGQAFVNPIFSNLKVEVAGTNPSLDSDTRDTIIIDTDGSSKSQAVFYPFKSGNPLDSNGKPKNFVYAMDLDSSSSTVTPRPLFDANRNYTIAENETIDGINDLVIINSGDNGRIVYVAQMPEGSLTSSSKVTLNDYFTGEKVAEATVGLTGTAQATIDGANYYFWVNPATNNTMTITWGAGASAGNFGSARTIFPRIKLQNGEWLAFLSVINVSNGTVISIPGLQDIATYESGITLTFNNFTTNSSFVTGNINYSLTYISGLAGAAGGSVGLITGITTTGASPDCIFNSSQSYGPAVLVIEEKKITEAGAGGSTNGDAICISGKTFGSTTTEIAIGDPLVTNSWSGLIAWTSDTYKKSAITRYGTYIEKNTQDNEKATIKYPDNQMYVDVLFAEAGATITAGTSGGGRVDELGTVAVMDSEVNSVSGKNLIVVGGSCVNSVAAKLLGSSSALCGSAFTTKTGVGPGQFLIETFASPVNGAKIATLVAGYEAGDTKQAVKYVTDPSKTVMTDKGKSYKKSSSTFADVSVA